MNNGLKLSDKVIVDGMLHQHWKWEEYKTLYGFNANDDDDGGGGTSKRTVSKQREIDLCFNIFVF